MAINIVRQSPLQWPAGWARTPQDKISNGNPRFLGGSLDGEVVGLRGELTRLGVDGEVILSTNKRGDIDTPNDRGVAVYFVRNGKRQCMPCDRWGTLAHNLHAITLSIGAIRGLERWGSQQVVDAAFAGFNALPAPGQHARRPWRDVMGFHPTAKPTNAQIDEAYKRLARDRHPDHGGNNAAFSELVEARKEALGATP